MSGPGVLLSPPDVCALHFAPPLQRQFSGSFSQPTFLYHTDDDGDSDGGGNEDSEKDADCPVDGEFCSLAFCRAMTRA